MLEPIALLLLAATWVTCTFTGLQLLAPPRSRRAGVGWAIGIGAGLVLMATHGPGTGAEWLRSEGARSDAIGAGVVAAALATVLGTQLDARIRTERWAATVAVVASLACSTAGTAALAMGRSTRSWDFLAMIAGGVLLAVVGALATMRRGASANVRIAFGTATLAGAFQGAAGVALLVAWRSLA